MDQPGKVAKLALCQLNKENKVSLQMHPSVVSTYALLFTLFTYTFDIDICTFIHVHCRPNKHIDQVS